jgi:hypothetical protein
VAVRHSHGKHSKTRSRIFRSNFCQILAMDCGRCIIRAAENSGLEGLVEVACQRFDFCRKQRSFVEQKLSGFFSRTAASAMFREGIPGSFFSCTSQTILVTISRALSRT